MSIAGIFSSGYSNYNHQAIQNNMPQIRQEFGQLGKDLQSGNLSAAQQDFATLQQLIPQASSTAAQSSNPIAQAFSQLGQDLQSGNLSAAQQDYSNLQRDVQTESAGDHHPCHHHHCGGGYSEISQLFSQLGQALQSGNLSTAQQAYTQLLQDLPQFEPNSGQTSAQSSSGNLSVSA